MDSAKLIALAERCEAADGPDRELDNGIFHATGAPLPTDFLGRGVALSFDEDQQCYFAPIGEMRVRYEPPRYTASLDAAMQLVPERWKLRQMHFNAPCADDRKWHLNLHGGKVGEDYFVGRSKSPALALCAASLRARAAMENNHD